MKIAAVVVTYNRRKLLSECLTALLSQTRPLDEIIVIDNASTDGTAQLIKEKFPDVTCVKLPENTGGAGGFHEGMKLAYEKGYDWIYLMDDDTIPDPDALLYLVSSPLLEDSDTGFLCSHVIWEDGQPHVMNIPQIAPLVIQKGRPVPFNSYLTDEVVFPVTACSFVSTLVRRDAIAALGLPLKEFFLWKDDIEYTTRITGCFAGYYIPQSRVKHKTMFNQGVSILTIPSDRLSYWFYEVRNGLYLAKTQGVLGFLFTLFYYLRQALKRHDDKLKVLTLTVKGVLAAVLFSPKIEYPNLAAHKAKS